ncbi:MAG: hypothetical protein AAFX87_13565 [Bacteroidota bacterium]
MASPTLERPKSPPQEEVSSDNDLLHVPPHKEGPDADGERPSNEENDLMSPHAPMGYTSVAHNAGLSPFTGYEAYSPQAGGNTRGSLPMMSPPESSTAGFEQQTEGEEPMTMEPLTRESIAGIGDDGEGDQTGSFDLAYAQLGHLGVQPAAYSPTSGGGSKSSRASKPKPPKRIPKSVKRPRKHEIYYLGKETDKCGEGTVSIRDRSGRTITIRKGEKKALRIPATRFYWHCGGDQERTSVPEGTNYVVAKRAKRGKKITWYCYHNFSIHSSRGNEAKAAIKITNKLLDTGFCKFDWAVTDNEAINVLKVLKSLSPGALLLTVRYMRKNGNWKKFRENLPTKYLTSLSRIDHKINPHIGYVMPGDTISITITSGEVIKHPKLVVKKDGVVVAPLTTFLDITEMLPRHAANVIAKRFIDDLSHLSPQVHIKIVKRGTYYEGTNRGPFNQRTAFSSQATVVSRHLTRKRKEKKKAFQNYLDRQRVVDIFTFVAINHYLQWLKEKEGTSEYLSTSPSELWKESLKKAHQPVNPAKAEGFKKLPESVYAIVNKKTSFYSSPEDPTPNKMPVLKSERVEVVWESAEWYYAFTEKGEEGYLKKLDVDLPPEHKKRPPTEEFVSLIGNILFIQAPNMNRAFILAKKSGLKPNVGMIFWYSNGRKKPYAVKYEIAIREPTAAELAKMRKLAGFSTITIPSGTSTSTTSPSTAKSKVAPTAKEKRWLKAAKELEPYVDKFLTTSSKGRITKGKMVSGVPAEWMRALNFTYDEFLQKKGWPPPKLNDLDPSRDSDYYYAVFQQYASAKIKEVMTRYAYKPQDPQQYTGGMEWLVSSKEALLAENEKHLEEQLEKIVEEEQEKRKADIEKFFEPHVKQIQKEQKEYIEKINKKASSKGWYQKEVDDKAAIKIMKERQELHMKKAEAEFRNSSLAKEIRKAVEQRYTTLVNSIIKPNPYQHPTVKADTTLHDLIKHADDKLDKAKNYKSRKAIFDDLKNDATSHITKKYPGLADSLIRIILVYFSDKLLISSDGKLTVYAIKIWAQRNKEDLDAAIIKFAPVFAKKKQQDEQIMGIMTPGGYSFTTWSYTDLAEELLFAAKFFQKILDHPENDEGFWDGFTSKSAAEYIPFIHTILKIHELYAQLRVSNKKLFGGQLTVSEEILLQAMAGLQHINQMKKKPFWYKVGEGVAEAVPFIGEFIVTAPIGLGAGSLAGKGMEKMIRKIAEKQLEKRLVKFIIKGVGVLAGSVAQTLANPLDIQKNIMQNKLNIVRMVANEDGSFTVEVEPSKETNASAAWKGFVSSFVNVLSERIGGHVLPFAASKVAGAFGRFIPMVVRSKVFTSSMKSVGQALKKYTGFHGILGEYEEELYGMVLESLLTGKQVRWNTEDQLQTFAVVAIIGSSMRGMQATIAAYDVMRTFRYKGKKTVLPKDVYNMLTQLTSFEQLTAFEEQLGTMKLSSRQKEVAMELASRVVELEHEIAARGKEQAAEQPTAEMPQTMSSLADLVVDLYKARKNFKLAQQENQANQAESVSLKGKGGESVPLLLYNIEHVDQWIHETETAIANLERLSLQQIKEAGQLGTSIEENIKFWSEWKKGWRPYRAPEVKVLADLKTAEKEYNKQIELNKRLKEVGIFHNPETNEYAVVVGDLTTLPSPPKPEKGTWEGKMHFHTSAQFNLPSVGDIRTALADAKRAQKPLREFLQFPTRDGKIGTVEYTVNPFGDTQVEIRIPQKDGAVKEHSFKDVNEYKAFLASNNVYVDPNSPLYRKLMEDAIKPDFTPGRRMADDPVGRAREAVQGSAYQIESLLARREGARNESERQQIDTEIEQVIEGRSEALSTLVLAENQNAELIDPVNGIYRVSMQDATGATRYLYGSVEAVWQLGQVNQSAFDLSTQLQSDPGVITHANVQATTAMGLGGSGIQSRAQPYPGDLDFSENYDVTAPDAASAAAAVNEMLMEFINRNIAAPNIELENVIISGLSRYQRLDQFLGLTDQQRIEAIQQLDPENGGNINTFWRVRLADGRYIQVSKILYVNAVSSVTGNAFFGTRRAKSFQNVYFNQPATLPDTTVGSFTDYMKGLIEVEVGEGNYLKATKRSYNYFLSVGNIEAMTQISEIFAGDAARLNQSLSELDAIASAATRARNVGAGTGLTPNDAADILERTRDAIQALGDVPPDLQPVVARIGQISFGFRGKSQLRGKDRKTIQEDIATPLKAYINNNVKTSIEPILRQHLSDVL